MFSREIMLEESQAAAISDLLQFSFKSKMRLSLNISFPNISIPVFIDARNRKQHETIPLSANVEFRRWIRKALNDGIQNSPTESEAAQVSHARSTMNFSILSLARSLASARARALLL